MLMEKGEIRVESSCSEPLDANLFLNLNLRSANYSISTRLHRFVPVDGYNKTSSAVDH